MRLLLIVGLFLLALAVPAQAANYVVGAAGDFNGSATSADPQAVATLFLIRSWNPNAVLGLGDYTYSGEAVGNSAQGFEAARSEAGLSKGLVRPTAGPTHDVNGASTALYRFYWGRDPYAPYSFDLGNWHIIQLPSPVYAYSTCGSQPCANYRSYALSWLNADLNRQPRSKCLLAYWHVPYYSSGTTQHSAFEGLYTKPWVDRLQAAGVDLILTGHQHGYERFRQNLAGATAVTIGTGGVGFYPWTQKASLTQQSNTYGALKLTLAPSSYAGQFLRSAGGSFSDAWFGSCNS